MTSPPHGLPRLLAGLPPGGAALGLVAHEQVHGPLPRLAPHALIALVEASGLRGRGGADFPTAQKLRAVAGAVETGSRRRSRRGVTVIVNASETEPASAKDRLLLTRLPHLVLDGAQLAAEAIGAEQVVVKVRETAVRSIAVLETALAERTGGIPVVLAGGPEGYVTGEETAVVHSLSRGRALPTFIPPRPYERGLHGAPTLIQNAETLAQIALIGRYGDTWYRQLGTAADPGSVLITISGAVQSPGVYELAFGTPLDELLAAAGGPAERLQALLVGGYFGTWIPAGRTRGLRLAREDLRSAGASLGSGVILALGESACGLHESARVIDYLARESAGQCGPCVFGLRAVADAVAGLASGRPDVDSARLRRWLTEIPGRGACHHPDGAIRFVASSLEVFAGEILVHERGPCRAAPAGLPLGPARSLEGVT